MEKIKIANPCRFEKFVEELEKNPSLARGFRRGTVPNDFKEQWESIATALNVLDPPNRTGDGWQKIWRDLKFKVKKKNGNKLACKATGDGVFKQLLSPLEESVANLLQFQKQINPEGMVQGVLNDESELSELEEGFRLNLPKPPIMEKAPANSSEAVTTPVAKTVTPSTTRITTPLENTSCQKENLFERKSSSRSKKSQRTIERHELLQKHSSDQARLLTDISNSMLSMKRNLRDIKEIEDKRPKVELQGSKREEELYEADMKIKSIEYLIKKKLEVLNSRTTD